MREIKFRAWDAKEKQMLEVNHLFNLNNKQPIEVWTNYYEGGYRFNPDKSELMQYTGLKDVNGKPIYEGDVVSFGSVWDNGDNEGLDEEIHIGVVEYDPHYAVYNVNCEESGERRFLLIDVVNYDGFGVVGNCFENPELLEDEK